MEYEFEIRRECLDGTQQIRPESGRGNHAHTARFISLAKKYTTLTELTQEALHTFVSRIEVHERTIDSFGKDHQDIDIYFTHIGTVK